MKTGGPNRPMSSTPSPFGDFYYDDSRFPKQLDWPREEEPKRGFYGGPAHFGPARLFIDGNDIGKSV